MKKLLLFITVLFFGISTINAQDDADYGFAQGEHLRAKVLSQLLNFRIS